MPALQDVGQTVLKHSGVVVAFCTVADAPVAAALGFHQGFQLCIISAYAIQAAGHHHAGMSVEPL